jgi:hypothetical protein
MDRRRSDQGWRATAFAAALLAITLNFLQPLVHAALMRDGGPATSGVWASMCLPDATPDEQGSTPAGKQHECCLGLAHALALAAPSSAFILVEPVVVAIRVVTDRDALAPVGIRDGPSQPRAPPLPA